MPSLEEGERRDTKGLYAKARSGKLKNFTGVSSPFEAPLHPVLELDTEALSVEEDTEQILEVVLDTLKY